MIGIKKNNWFLIVPIETTNKDKELLLEKKLVIGIKKFFFFKGKTINYYEPYTNKEGKSFVIFGSSKSKITTKNRSRYNRNVVIFILELYAYLEDEKYKVTDMFKKTIKTINNKEVEIYKIKNY